MSTTTRELAGRCEPPRATATSNPARVAVDNDTTLAPMTIAVDGRDGLQTMIRIEYDPDVGE